jgi:phosphatidylglycerol:prolipoprotein diacylglycerol transferase
MLPYFSIGPFTFPSYGIFVALAFVVIYFASVPNGKKAGIPKNEIFDAMFWSVVIGLLGARLLFVIPHWDLYVSNPLGALKFWEGGIVFLGAPLAIVPLGFWYCRRYGLSALNLLDVAAAGIAWGHGTGRIGCILAGCCHGKPTGGDWGFVFNGGLVSESLWGVPLHPTQLYEIGALAILGGVLWKIFQRRRFEGQVILIYFMSYAVIRSVIEVFRGDQVRGFVIDGWLSTSQFISILIFALAAAVYAIKSKRNREPLATA